MVKRYCDICNREIKTTTEYILLKLYQFTQLIEMEIKLRCLVKLLNQKRKNYVLAVRIY